MAARPVTVEDPADPRLGAYRHLNDRTLRSRLEGELGVFVVEGTLALGQLVASDYEVASVLVAASRLEATAPLLAGVDAPVYVAAPDVLAATVGFDLHRGVVAVGRRRPPLEPDAIVATSGPLLVIEGVNDHENLGALFRTARALGVTGVLVDPTCADPLYRRSIRVSLGHVLRLPHATVASWPAGLSALGAGRRLVALTPDPGATPIDALGAGPVAVMVGAEGPGLSAAARGVADVAARIPMAAGVDSLNVATAAGIALHRLVPRVGRVSVELQGSVAVVTGGGSGIGAALAARLTAAGARVAVVDLDAGKASAVAGDLDGAVGYGVDVTDREAVTAMVERVRAELGPIAVYCSNAGIAAGLGLGEDEDWARSWAVHGMAHVHAARAVLPQMGERGTGAFVVTASAAGLLAMMQSAPYTATKHASVAIAEWLSITYGGDGVSVHALCPQGVNTPMVQGGDARGTSELQAAGGIIEPAQVADDVVAALASGTFLILPHPEVRGYEQAKVADRDRWLRGMRKLLARVAAS